MRWTYVALCWTVAALVVLPAATRAQTSDSPLPVSLEHIRAGLNEPPPVLRAAGSSGDLPTFRIEVRQPFWDSRPPIEEEPFDPTMGLPSVGELLMGGIDKIRSAAVGYKRARAEGRARKEVADALAAFCAVHECPAPDPAR